MCSEDGYPIEITHYINPHLFWFKSKEVSTANAALLANIEGSMQALYAEEENHQNHGEIKFDANDMVALKYLQMDKYIRAKILHRNIMHKDEYILWAMDYGFPLQTKEKYIKHLSGDLCTHRSIIRRGGLNGIIPSKTATIPNFVDDISLYEWSKEACDGLKDLITNASVINFIENWKSDNDHYWGDLHIHFESFQINACKYLLNDYAISVNNRNYTNMITANISIWLKNSFETNVERNELNNDKMEYAIETTTCKIEDCQVKNTFQNMFTSSNSSICSVIRSNDGSVSEEDGEIVCYTKDFGQQRNYICKGATLIKIKNNQLKVAGPPKWPGDGHFKVGGPQAAYHRSEASYESNKQVAATRLKRLTQLRERYITDNDNKIPSSTASSASSVSIRTAKLIAMREQQLSRQLLETESTSMVENEYNKNVFLGEKKTDILSRTKQLIAMREKLSKQKKKTSTFTENLKELHCDSNDTSNEQDISTAKNLKKLRRTIVQVTELQNSDENLLEKAMEIIEKKTGEQGFPKACKLNTETCVSARLQLIKTVMEADFLSMELRATMQTLGINDMLPMQESSWRYITEGQSLFLVDREGSGKTWSYLPSICNGICKTFSHIKNSFGPVCIIIVANEEHVCRVSVHCSTLLKSRLTQLMVVPFYGKRNLRKTKIALLNGCAMLVTTYTNFLHLLDINQNEPLFDNKSLQHVVVDDLDIIIETSGITQAEIFQTIMKVCEISEFSKLQAQCIITSSTFYEIMESLRREVRRSLLLIGDPIEASVYIGTKFNIVLNSCKLLLENLLHFISGVESIGRTVIVCNTNEEVDEIKYHIECLCKYSWVRFGSEFFSDSQLTDTIVKNQEHAKSKAIIITTDDRLWELRKTDIRTLIHYGMPKSWTTFSERFNIFISHRNSLNKIINPTNGVPYEEYRTESLILVATDHYAHNILDLREFMRKHGKLQKNSKLEQITKSLLTTREEHGISEGIPLCPNLLEFGKCNLITCNDRHTITNSDTANGENGIPLNGNIRIHVLQVFSPIHFAGRLLTHKPEHSEHYSVVRSSTENLKFIMQFNIHYGSQSNLSIHSPLRVNDICIYKYLGSFVRARISKLQSSTDFNFTCKEHIGISSEDLHITLKLIDDGAVIHNVKPLEVFVCEKQFQDFPAQAVDIRLHGIVPKDNENVWSSKITKLVKDRIVNDLKENELVHIGVNHVFADTIWINNLLVLEKLPNIGALCTQMNLKNRLLGGGFAMLTKNKTICDLALEKGLLQADDFKVVPGDKIAECIQETTFPLALAQEENTFIKAQQILEQDFQLVNSQKLLSNFGNLYTEINASSHKQLTNFSKTIEENLLTERISSAQCTKIENWCKLEINKLNEVRLANEHNNGHWENIFFQITGEVEKREYQQLQHFIKHHVGKINVIQSVSSIRNSISLSNNYIVQHNKSYQRAKLVGIYGGNHQDRLHRFFLCDIGTFINLNSKDLLMGTLYESTEEIVSFTPYQSVHCKLDGLDWSVSTKYYPITKSYLFAQAIKKNDFKNYGILENLPINSYTVLVYEYDDPSDFSSGHLFNKILHDLGIIPMDWQPDTYPLISNPFALSKLNNNKTTDAAKDVNSLLLNDFMKCLYNNSSKIEAINMSQSMLDKNTTKNSSNTIIDNIKRILETTKLFLQQTESAMSKKDISKTSNANAIACKAVLHTTNLPSLTKLHNQPKTTCCESDNLLHFTIYVPYIEKYGVRVTANTLHFVANVNEKSYALILHLLGSVNPKQTSHEKCGRNIVVRLSKLVPMKWPRLLCDAVKLPWLTYDIEAIERKYEPHDKPGTLAVSTDKDGNGDMYGSSKKDDFLLLGI